MLNVQLPQEQEILLKNQILDGIKDIIKSEEVSKRYYNRKDLCTFLKIGVDTLETLKDNGLNYVKLGRQYLFDINEVYSILEKMKKS